MSAFRFANAALRAFRIRQKYMSVGVLGCTVLTCAFVPNSMNSSIAYADELNSNQKDNTTSALRVDHQQHQQQYLSKRQTEGINCGSSMRDRKRLDFIEFCREHAANDNDNNDNNDNVSQTSATSVLPATLFMTPHNNALIDVLMNSLDLVTAGNSNRYNNDMSNISHAITLNTTRQYPLSLVYSPHGHGKSFVVRQFMKYVADTSQFNNFYKDEENSDNNRNNNVNNSNTEGSRSGRVRVIPMHISCKDLIGSDRSVLEVVVTRLQHQQHEQHHYPPLNIDYDPLQHWNVFKHIGKSLTKALIEQDCHLLLVIDDIELLYQVDKEGNNKSYNNNNNNNNNSNGNGQTQTEKNSSYKALLKTLVNMSWLAGRKVNVDDSSGSGRDRGRDSNSARIAVVLMGNGGSGSIPLLLSNLADPVRYPGQLIKVLKDGANLIGLPAQPLTSFTSFQVVMDNITKPEAGISSNNNSSADNSAIGGSDADAAIASRDIDSSLLPLYRLVSFYCGNSISNLFNVLNNTTADNTITPTIISEMQLSQQQRLANTLGRLYDTHFVAYLFYMELIDVLRAKNATVLKHCCDAKQLELSALNRGNAPQYKGDELRGALVDPSGVMNSAWEKEVQPLSTVEIQRAWNQTCSRHLFLQNTKQLPSDIDPHYNGGKKQKKKLVLNGTDYLMCKQILATLVDEELLFSTPVEFGSMYEKLCYPVCLYQLLV